MSCTYGHFSLGSVPLGPMRRELHPADFLGIGEHSCITALETMLSGLILLSIPGDLTPNTHEEPRYR